MPILEANGARIHYTESGNGGEAILFSHGLLWSGRMFDAQVMALSDRYRCITFDHRGQGQSAVTEGGYDMDTLTQDAALLIEALDAAPCHFVGLSMGGFVGMRLAIRRPDLLRSLILLETTAQPEPIENVGRYRRLNFVARWIGLRPVTKPVMSIMFGRKFLTDVSRTEQRAEMRRQLLANDRTGITRAVVGVVDREGVVDDLDKIRVPTLIGVGDQDVATTPAKSEQLHAAIEGSQLVIFPGAGHSSSVEEPVLVTTAIESFLTGLAQRSSLFSSA